VNILSIKCTLLLVATAVASVAYADEPQWWTNKKQQCGLDRNLAYETWRTQGYRCSGANSGTSSADPAVQLGTALGNAVGDALIQSFQQAGAERAQRLQQMNEESRAHQQQEDERLAEQARNDARHTQSAVANLEGVLKFSDPNPSPVRAPADSGVQLNPGALTTEALSLRPSGVSGAAISSTAKEQLLSATSGKETLGQAFDNGNGAGDVSVSTAPPVVTTPSSEPLDAKLVNNKDYQAAAATLVQTKATADALNKKRSDLEAIQTTSPTPERQIEIYNLSGQVNGANGALLQAQNNLRAVKRTIEGSPVIVDATSGSSSPAPISPAP
jgi:hypothetical protein